VINGTSAPLVNQRLAPDDVQVSRPDGAAYFERLGIYTTDADGKITVTLSDKANGVVVADAIRLLMHQPSGALAGTSLSAAPASMSAEMTAALDSAMSDLAGGSTGRNKSTRAGHDLVLATYDPLLWL